jgi:DNA replication protein DnaC
MADRQAEMRLMLRNLRMPAIAALYEDLALKAAKANLTHEAFLYELVRAECLQREEHRVARLQRLSGLPPDKTFRTLQLEQFPPLIREQLERLRSGAFIDDAVNLVAAGKPGVGKSHALAAIGHELVLLGHGVLWTPTATLVQELLAAKRDLRLPRSGQARPLRLRVPRRYRLRPARPRRDGGAVYVPETKANIIRSCLAPASNGSRSQRRTTPL